MVLIVIVFSLAVFANALLLFSVQPMVSRMLLPLLGGAPLVWNTAMVCFQGLLLAGYGYAFVATRRLTVRSQVLLHVALLALALLTLPVAVRGQPSAADLAVPQFWLVSTLAAAVGLPFLVLAASSTLFQNWFAHSGHPRARDPYFLYAASNAGSLIALLAYPFAIEPLMDLARQTAVWQGAYLAQIAVVVACGSLLWRRPESMAPPADMHPADSAGPTASGRLRWLFLAFVPSMMLLGVTLHLSTEVGSFPFLWVVPLALYLLSFIVAFAWPRHATSAPVLLAQVLALGLVLLLFSSDRYLPSLAAHLGLLYLSSLICHGALAGSRPGVAHLGEFYVWVSVGGWLGGLVGGIVAPLVFNDASEYPIAIGLACLARLAAERGGSVDWRSGGLWLAMAVLLVLTLATRGLLPGILVLDGGRGGQGWPQVVLIPVALLLVLVRKQPLALALVATAAALNAMPFSRPPPTGAQPSAMEPATLLFRERTFFGIHRVFYMPGSDTHELIHGSTSHGSQALDPALIREPRGYYHRAGPLGDLVVALRRSRPLRSAGIIGLGTGATACLFQSGEQVTYFEIDPTVAALAQDPTYFSFLRLCGNPAVVMGDGRLTLEKVPDESLDLVIVDAFSSDAIPVHLLTREAVGLYFRKLRAQGLVVLHTSNRYLDLTPVLNDLAWREGYFGAVANFTPTTGEWDRGATPSRWVVLARRAPDLQPLARTGVWQAFETLDLRGRLWTDQHANVLGALQFPDLLKGRSGQRELTGRK